MNFFAKGLQTINSILLPFFFILSGGLIFLSSLRVDINVQAFITIVLLVLLLSLRQFRNHPFTRILFLTLSSFLVLRYFFWRINYTLSYQDFLSFIGTMALFSAEMYGVLMFFLSVLINIQPLNRKPVPLPADKSLWPTVDVIIPSYDEPVDLVKITLAAAGNIDYPADKLKIYLLDDGGTEQKLTTNDEDARQAALSRVKRFKKLCSDLGVSYLSRGRNLNAKAGNMNAALKHIHGELILVLDADHAPSVDILTKTVGSFVLDEKVFLVQTPHFFINPDPIEKNLNLFQKMPSENLMFYRSIQRGLDFWQSSFFCGSAAVLRRQAIDEAGGFCGCTITEDSETALKLHSLGWKSHYIFYPLISGLQPETFDSFMIQRMRWAQGMVQNFILNNPLFMPNLKIWQRLSYLSNMAFWFFPFARLVFLIAPGLYLCFGLKIYKANIYEFFSYTIPYLLALMLTTHYLFSRDRWIFVSEIYETMQSLFSIRAVWAVLKNPHQPRFAVTPKMETLERDFISPLSRPFYWVIMFTLVAVALGVWKFWFYPDERTLIGITLFWAAFNLLLLLAALGALYEQRQRRITPRIPVNIDAYWLIKSAERVKQRVPINIKDISMGGSNLVSEHELPKPDKLQQSLIEVFNEKSRNREYYKASIVTSFKQGKHSICGIKFDYSSLSEFVDIVRFVHGDSSRWILIQDSVSHDPGLIKTMFFMIRIGVYSGLIHFKQLITSFFSKEWA